MPKRVTFGPNPGLDPKLLKRGPYLTLDPKYLDPADEFLKAHPRGIQPPPLAIDPKILDPIHLTAEVTIQPNSNGGVNAIALQNPLGLPMELLEVKWMVTSVDGSFPNGGAIACSLSLANIPITQGYIPIWNFGPCRNAWQELINNTGSAVLYPLYSWKLEHPLFIPGGACVQPLFQHRGMIKDPITVRISYSCRTLPKDYVPPKKIKIPYVAAYVSKSFQPNALLATSTLSDTSKETDLVNRWDHPVQIHRWIGRCDLFNTFSGEFHEEANEEGASRILVAIRDSRGQPIVGGVGAPIPFRLLFSKVSRTWDVDYPIAARAWYRATVTRTPLVVTDATLITQVQSFLIQPMMSFVGTHEMDRGGLS